MQWEDKMIVTRLLAATLASSALALVAANPSLAQQTNGELGSPGATTSISGEQLPAPDLQFGGAIKDDALQSKPWWAPRVVPPKGAPNVLLIITDDAGFGVPSTFGGVIPTPTMDRIGSQGLRYNRICSTALCSPTRAALITGRNHHSAGFGVVSERPHEMHELQGVWKYRPKRQELVCFVRTGREVCAATAPRRQVRSA
jgi:hypothetical protein